MDREKLTEEILEYLDGALDADRERALAARIKGDEEAEKLLADLMRLHGSVPAVVQERVGEKAAKRELGARTPPRGLPRVAPKKRFSRELVWVLATAAAAVVLIAIAALTTVADREGRPIAGPSPRIVPPKEEAPPPQPPPPPPPPPPPAPVPLPAPVPKIEEPRKPEPPAPAPTPEPPPVKVETPAPKPEPPRTTTVVEAPKAPPMIVQLDRVKGDVYVVVDGAKTPAKEGQMLLAGQALGTTGAESQATARFVDGTSLELTGDTAVSQIAEGTAKTGKRVVLDSGTITAKAVKQPVGQPMIFVTPQAEARILGTILKLTVDADATRLEVKEGRVRLTRKSDGASTEVGVDQFAIASAGPKPIARKIGSPLPGRLVDDFEDPQAVKARWQPLDGGFPTTTASGVEVDLSPRPGDSYAEGGWHAPGGLRSRQAFALPIRITVEVEVSHKDVALNAIVVLIPASQKTGALKNELGMRVRGPDYGILVDGQPAKTAPSSMKPGIRERWTFEVDRTEAKFFVDGREVLRHAHGLTLTEDVRVELHGAAKADAPKGARVRFDNVRVEP